MEKVKIRFLKPYKMVLEGKEVSFREKEIAELHKSEALRLFKSGIILPGPQEGGPVANRFEV